MKKECKVKILTIILITAIIMGISSITIYSNVCAPKFYDYFIDTGIKYLIDGKYAEAILAFNKAIEIEEKSTEARVYLAKGYIGNNEYDKSIEVLEEAQNIDMANEELLKQILEILNEIDPDVAYEFLDRFINEVGKDNISEDIKNMLYSATKSPSIPAVDPEPGTYIKPISIKLKLGEIKVGHSFYYTTDGSEPNKNSQKYRGKIDIDKSTTIKLVGYNKNGESTEIVNLDYIIDTNIVNDIEDILEESKDLLDNTEEGTNVGNCIKGSKKKFKDVINSIKNSLDKDSITYDIANEMYEKLSNALDEFKYNIIEQTDKNILKEAIEKAQNIYEKSEEGSGEGQFKVGSKEILLTEIKKANKVYTNILSKQEDVDNSVKNIKEAINIFQNNKVKKFTKENALTYMIAEFGEEERTEWGTENTYRFKSELLYENGKAYYKIENYNDLAGIGTAYDPSTIYHVYEDGSIRFIYNSMING